MPSGAKKRKAAKKKKVNDSSTTNPHQVGENLSSENKLKDANEEEVKVEIEIGSKSKSSKGSSSSSSDSSDDDSRVVEKNVVVLESAPRESVPAVESLPEKDSPIVDPVKPVDSLLEEVSQVFDEIENEKKKGVVVEEERVVVSETVTKDDTDDHPTSSVVAEMVKENDGEKLVSVDETDSSVSNECVPSSTPPENLISEVNGADYANETDTIGDSNRQAPAASTAVAVQSTTTWKSCCGIFELFSRSDK